MYNSPLFFHIACHKAEAPDQIQADNYKINMDYNMDHNNKKYKHIIIIYEKNKIDIFV